MHAVRALTSLILLLLLAACGSEDQQGDPADHIAAGEVYLDQGQYRAALIEVQNARQLNNDYEPAWVLEAKINNALGNYRYSYRQLEQIKGTSPEYILALAEAYLNTRKYSSALVLLRKHAAALKAVPVQTALYSGRAFTGLNDLDAARENFEKALALDPNSVGAKIGLVTLLGIRGDVISAEVQLLELVKQYPDSVEAHTLLTTVYMTQGRLQEAEENLTQTVSMLPTTDIYTMQRAGVMQTLISLLAQQGRSGEALIYQRTLAEAFPGAEQNNQKFQEALEKIGAGDVEQAQKMLRELYSEAPGHQTGGALLGIVNFVQGDDVAAQRYFSDAVDLETASTPVLKAMAMSLYRMNQPQKVLDTLRERVKTTDDPEALSIYGIAAFTSGQQEEGLAALNRSLDLEPDNARIRLLLIQYHNSLIPPDREHALTLSKDGYEIVPENHEIRLGYINQLALMGRQSEAEAIVREQQARWPEDYGTNILSGAFWLRNSSLSTARDFYNAALAIDPHQKPAYFGLGVINIQEGRYAEARRLYKEILRRDANEVNAYRGILQTYISAGVPEDGLAALEQMSASNFDSAGNVIAEYHAKNNSLDEAQEILAQLESRAVDTYETRQLKAEINYRRATQAAADGNFKEAREAIFSALSAFPLNLRILRKLAQIEVDSKQFGEAEKVLAEMRGYHPDSPLVDEVAGDIALAQSQFVSAQASYEKAWKYLKTDPVALKLVQAMEGNSLGGNANVDAFAAEWRAAMPHSVTALEFQLQRLDDSDLVIAQYRAFLEQQPDTPSVLNNLAWAYSRTGQPLKGLEYARRAHELVPSNALVMDTFGWLLHQTGDNQRAVTLLQRASTMVPGNQEIRGHLDAVRGAL